MFVYWETFYVIVISFITYYDSNLAYSTPFLMILLQLNNLYILVDLILFFYSFLDTIVGTRRLKNY